MIVALTFTGGRVHLRCKFVASKHRLEEQKERKFLYRGQMGTHPSSALKDTMVFLSSALTLQWPKQIYRNPSNTNVFYWGGKVSVMPVWHHHLVDYRWYLAMRLVYHIVLTLTLSTHWELMTWEVPLNWRHLQHISDLIWRRMCVCYSITVMDRSLNSVNFIHCTYMYPL